mgnify:CR=1 FL=1
MSKTIFGKIAAKEIPAKLVYEDDRVVAFRDINPQAPVHILIIPREEIARVSDTKPAHEALLGHLVWVASEVARREGVESTGYRLVINNGPDAGESVPHLHVHLLAGRALGWPPG